MKMQKNMLAKLAALSVAAMMSTVAVTSSAWAHDDKYFDSIKSPHGGQTRMAGPYHFELVLKAGASNAQASPVVVYVTDHAGKAISTKGATANLLIVQGKQKITVELKPQADNQLVGQAAYNASADLKAALSFNEAGKGVEQARFTPFAPVKGSKAKNSKAQAEAGHEHHH